MRKSALMNGDLDEVLFCGLYALGDCGAYFIGLAETPAYDAVFVTDNDDCSESEGATALGYFGYAVDGNEAILKFQVVGRFYAVLIVCHNLQLEFKAAFTSGVSQRFNTTVEEIAVTVENDSRDACFQGLLSSQSAYLGGYFALGAPFKSL